jgi:hypothetical protein
MVRHTRFRWACHRHRDSHLEDRFLSSGIASILGSSFFCTDPDFGSLWGIAGCDTVEGINYATQGTPLGPPGGPRGNPPKPPGIAPRRARDRWIPSGGSIVKPTPAVGDRTRVLPVSLRLRPTYSVVVSVNLYPEWFDALQVSG